MSRCSFRRGLIRPTEGAEVNGSKLLTGKTSSNQDAEHHLAKMVMNRIETLARISEEPGRLTRTFCSPAMRRANDLVATWMRKAGMTVREDEIGNLLGHYPADASNPKTKNRKSKTLLLGSHLDTVRNAGKFDGSLGVLVAIACVQHLHDTQTRLPFSLDVIGFCDEEGVRFQSTYLGSKVLAGTFDSKDLKRADDGGVTMAEAIRSFGGRPSALAKARLNSERFLGYAEVHIEQGPVLEQRGLSVGVVIAIAGQSRVKLTFTGQAGHAGTTPMDLRRDALCAAAEFILAVEWLARSRGGLAATVGEIVVLPGVSNVIPAQATLSLDVRHAEDTLWQRALSALRTQAFKIAQRRNLLAKWQLVHEAASVACNRRLSAVLRRAVKLHENEVMSLPSGAGHDAAAMAAITPVAMLFVRCKGGISHRPDESVATKDVRVAIAVMNEFLQKLAISR